MSEINWTAVGHALDYWKNTTPSDLSNKWNSYHDWMLENWGIDHDTNYIKIVDEKKYFLFLLRWL